MTEHNNANELIISKKTLDYLGYFGPQILFFATIYILTISPKYLFIYVAGYLLNMVLNFVLKGIIKGPRPSEDIKLFNIAINNGKRFGWDRYGMPSGHSQISGFSTAFMYCVTGNIYALLIYVAVSVNTMYQRVKFKNHSILQVIIGYSVGLLWGIFTFMIGKKIIDGKLREKKDDNAPL